MSGEVEHNNQGRSEVGPSKRFDLEERTARFGEAAIALARCLPLGPVTEPLIRQLVRSATSVGANYCEADDAGSKKEFRYRISVCRRESRETKHWLRMIASAAPGQKDESRKLWREARELNLIFAAIFRGKSGP
jgi:four helix bundle protein